MEDILYKETEKTNMISAPVQRVNSYEENGFEVSGKHIFPHKTDPNKRIVTIQNKKFFIHDKSSPSPKRSKGRKKNGKRKSKRK